MNRARVAIIGAGIIGLACALRLAREGFDVAVLDELPEGFRRGGANASVSAAGMLAPISEAAAHASDHPHADALALLSFDYWRQGAGETSWAAFVRFDGAVITVQDEASAAQLVRNAGGRRVAALDAVALRREIGQTAGAVRAFFIQDEGALDPERVYEAMAAEARARGVVFRHGFSFDGLGAVSVYEAGGAPIPADHVVIAPGITSDRRLMEAVPALRHIRPAKGHLVPIVAPTPIRLTLHAPGFYIARRWNGELVLGSTMEWDRADLDVDPIRVRELLEAANAFFGGGVSQVGQAWAGVRPMSPDAAPLIGPVRTAAASAILAAGHGRNGWLLAPVTAEIVCAYLRGQTIPRLFSAFHPDRFEKTS